MAVDSTVADLDDLIKASAAVRRPFEADAYLNLSFYAGSQWVAYDGTMLFEPQLEDWREQVVDNRIRPFVRTEIAKMTKTRPVWVGVPRSQADEDIAGARYAEDVLDDAWQQRNMVRKLRAALLWSRVCTAGFWKIWWDSSVGDSRDVLVYAQGHQLAGQAVKNQAGAPIPPDMLHQLPEDVARMMETRKVSAGDYRIDMRTFFEMYPDPHCGEEGLEDAEWVGEEAVYTRDYVRRHLPEWADQLTYDAAPSAGISESRWPAAGTMDVTVPSNSKGVKLREYWSPEKHVIWTPGGQILREVANPYGWLPYVMFRGTPVPGRFWPDCTVTDLRPRQVDLNKRLSQIAENAERIGNPPLTVPSSMGDDVEWFGLPGEQLTFQDNGSPNSRPQFLDVPELPAYVQNDVDRTLASMMDISGQHEVSAGSVPAGVTAASAINMLQEQDDTRLGPDIGDMEVALAQAGRRVLDLVARFYDDRRHIRVAGDDGAWDVAAFKDNMLRGCAEIQVQAGSGMPQSKAAKQAAIQANLTTLLQAGVPVSERSLRKILSEYDIGGLEQFFASSSRDENQIQEENRVLAAMTSGKLEINSYDNDEAHVEGHEDFQKTAKYQRLPDSTKAIYEGHVAAHRDRIAVKAQAAADAAGPQPPPDAPGSPPQIPLPSAVPSSPPSAST